MDGRRWVRAPRSGGLLGVLVAGCALGLAGGCTGPDDVRTPSLAGTTPPTPMTSATPLAEEGPTRDPAAVRGPVLPAATADPQDVLTGLTTPWSLAFLPGGAVLLTLRDTAQVLIVTDAGVRTLTGPGADDLAATTRHEGEAGLLGLAVPPDVDDGLVYLYRTTAQGNEVVRAPLDPVAATLGPLETVLDGIPAAGHHDGGRIAFGPDGYLYVGTGDAGRPDAAQDPGSLAGKILRVTGDGRPAPGNPVATSPVWSLGHRNVQGLGWTSDGRMVASELGQDTWDELNVIEPGGNYGWPRVEGTGGAPDLVDPVVTWPTDDASPSGLAVVDDVVHVAALRGERMWVVRDVGGSARPVEVLTGRLGRLRDVVAGPDGALWVLTQNTDGRGDPRPGDDRVVRLLPP